MTDLEIRALVRKQIIYYLKEDLTGGELLKEVWEQCETPDHEDVVKQELSEIIAWLQDEAALAVANRLGDLTQSNGQEPSTPVLSGPGPGSIDDWLDDQDRIKNDLADD